jgi:hypothetical protein
MIITVAEHRGQREQEHHAADVDEAAFQGLACPRHRELAVGEEPDGDGVATLR